MALDPKTLAIGVAVAGVGIYAVTRKPKKKKKAAPVAPAPEDVTPVTGVTGPSGQPIYVGTAVPADPALVQQLGLDPKEPPMVHLTPEGQEILLNTLDSEYREVAQPRGSAIRRSVAAIFPNANFDRDISTLPEVFRRVYDTAKAMAAAYENATFGRLRTDLPPQGSNLVFRQQLSLMPLLDVRLSPKQVVQVAASDPAGEYAELVHVEAVEPDATKPGAYKMRVIPSFRGFDVTPKLASFHGVAVEQVIPVSAENILTIFPLEG